MLPRIFFIALCVAAAPRACAWGREGHEAIGTLAAELPKDYEATQKLRAQTQLAKAAVHLADLLNALDWKVP